MRSFAPPARVLVTGFGPFPGVPYNASASLVHALAEDSFSPGIEVATEIIPVVWAGARAAVSQAIARIKPHAVLHFGVSKRAAAFEVETRAFNVSGPKADHTETARPAKALIRAGKPVLQATLPAFPLVRALRTGGYPAELSRDPGRYLCNAVLYWSLADASSAGPLVTFIHMPALGVGTAVKSSLTMEKAIEGARILIRASTVAVLRAQGSRANQRGGSNSHASQALHRTGRGGRLVGNSRG
jgi:pyroglutamyl-peptidase